MKDLQTVLDALILLGRAANLSHDASSVEAEAIAIVRGMMHSEPVACLVETEQSVMVWPIDDFNDAGTYCEPNQFPQYLYTQPEPQAVPAWLPIESAPKDGTVILGYCVHTADPYFTGERLTDYGARCEGLGHVGDGIHAILWESAREESDGWESPSYWIPAGWVHNADCEQMANPTHWMPLPASPEEAV